MSRSRMLATLSLGGLLLFAAAAAQASTITCESRKNSYQSCPVDASGGVRLSRQLSSQGCWQNDTWGFDRNRIWVDRGCRAEFQVGGQSSSSASKNDALAAAAVVGIAAAAIIASNQHDDHHHNKNNNKNNDNHYYDSYDDRYDDVTAITTTAATDTTATAGIRAGPSAANQGMAGGTTATFPRAGMWRSTSSAAPVRANMAGPGV